MSFFRLFEPTLWPTGSLQKVTSALSDSRVFADSSDMGYGTISSFVPWARKNLGSFALSGRKSSRAALGRNPASMVTLQKSEGCFRASEDIMAAPWLKPMMLDFLGI